MSSVGAFLFTALYLIYLYTSFISCTCWVPTISVLNLTIFPCYSNLLLRRRWWVGILQRGVLGYESPRLPFLWCYGVFRCSVSQRVVLVFKRHYLCNNYTLYYDIWLSMSTFGRMCETIDPGSCIRWVLGFGIKPGMTIAQFGLHTQTTRLVDSNSCWDRVWDGWGSHPPWCRFLGNLGPVHLWGCLSRL
jgi:hypothetical protein